MYGYYYGFNIKDCCGSKTPIVFVDSNADDFEASNYNINRRNETHHDDILILQTESFVSNITGSLLHKWIYICHILLFYHIKDKLLIYLSLYDSLLY